MGTRIQALGLSADDFGGAAYEGCNEHLTLTRPDVIEGIHRSYLEAGCDIVETDTFGATPLVLGEYGLAEKAYEVNRAAAALARRVCDDFEDRDGRPRIVAGSIGPTTRTLSVTGGITFAEMVDHYAEQARGLVDGGVDVLLVETAFDARNVKAALVGIERALGLLGARRPVAISATIETMGTTLAGQTIDAFYASVEHADPLWVGMNCATGPAFMRDHLRTLAGLARTYVAAVPNAGLPDADGRYHETPESFVQTLAGYLERGWLNLVGGCCGTGPEHIRALAAAAAAARPRRPASYRRTILSGVEFQAIDDDRPYLVGERTNVLGSRKFKRLVAAGAWEEAAEVARAQVRAGAHIIDVCLQDPDRDEAADMRRFLAAATRIVKVPFMIDSTDPAVVEEALTWLQGKGIVNSINLEDGEERFRKVCPLLRRYGAAVVVGCIDDDPTEGQARTADRKMAVAERAYRLLTEKYEVPGEDIVWDPLVFPAGTGDANYVGAARETLEAIRRLKARFPETKTILGISNVSFGLPPAGREVLNSVFLHHAVEAGLDMAIVNTEGIERYAQIPDEERRLAEALLEIRYDDPDRLAKAEAAVAAFTGHFRSKAGRAKRPAEDRLAGLGLEERVARRIVLGTKEGQMADLDSLLAGGMTPLAIINGPLMRGMDEVGRLFAANELIVAEVLQSAEVMKASVAHLEPHMERVEDAGRGTVILATVKGDVHDIGKNLVEIILANNGFRVVNLGIKVPPEAIVEAVRAHRPDIVGLSGLLVKSAQMMVSTAEDLRAAGVDVPLLVGGAALTRRFTDERIRPAYGGLAVYAKDAMEGLDLAKRLMDAEGRARIVEALRTARPDQHVVESRRAPAASGRSAVRVLAPDEIPRPPDLKPHAVDLDAEEVWRWVNPQMLYARHMGLKGDARRLLSAGDAKAVELRRVFEDLLVSFPWRVRGLYRFFQARADGDAVEMEGERIVFPRQAGDERLCLADYVRPDRDTLALFAVTAGAGVRERAEEWKNAGEYLKSHALAAMALEMAEAAAEFLHAKIRAMWGIGGPAEAPIPDLLRGAYRGRRYSPGYPAWPNLDDQAVIWRLLRPDEEIGVALTEGGMMDPEASVSALVFHHPEAKYFGAGEGGG